MIETVVSYALSIGFKALNIEFSPIKGPEGNIEYLVHLQKTDGPGTLSDMKADLHNVVDAAFEALAK